MKELLQHEWVRKKEREREKERKKERAKERKKERERDYFFDFQSHARFAHFSGVLRDECGCNYGKEEREWERRKERKKERENRERTRKKCRDRRLSRSLASHTHRCTRSKGSVQGGCAWVVVTGRSSSERGVTTSSTGTTRAGTARTRTISSTCKARRFWPKMVLEVKEEVMHTDLLWLNLLCSGHEGLGIFSQWATPLLMHPVH